MHIESSPTFFGRREDPFVSGRPTMGFSSAARTFSAGRPSTIKSRGVPSMNMRPAMPGGKQVISKVPRMKRESPAMHVEKAKAGIKVQQESDQSVLDRMKRDANFHIEYFYPGVDSAPRMDVPMKSLSMVPTVPVDPLDPTGPKENVFHGISRKIDAREATASTARNVANADTLMVQDWKMNGEAASQRVENAKLQNSASKDARAALHKLEQAREVDRKERRDIARYASAAVRDARAPPYVPPKTLKEYNEPMHQRHRAVLAADEVVRRGGTHEEARLAADTARKELGLPSQRNVPKPGQAQAQAPLSHAARNFQQRQTFLTQLHQTDAEGFWDPSGMSATQRTKQLGKAVKHLGEEVRNMGGTTSAIINAYRANHPNEVKQTGILSNQHQFRAFSEAIQNPAMLQTKRPARTPRPHDDGAGPSSGHPWDPVNIPQPPPGVTRRTPPGLTPRKGQSVDF